MDGIGDETSEFFHGQAQLYRVINLWMAPLCVKCAIELEIPDIIHKHGKPISLSHLVSALKIPPSKTTFVKGLMHLLAHNGIFSITKSNNNEEESEEEVSYDLTSASKLLVSGTDHCLSPMVLLATYPSMINLYHHLGKWARGDESTLKETIFNEGNIACDLFKQNPADIAVVQEGMASDSRLIKVALIRDFKYVFDGLSSIVDVGGGTGTVAKIICEAFPNLKCTVLDLPEVVSNLSGNTNLSFVFGDMFKFIPPADAVLIKSVLLNWDDEDCIKVLKNAKEAISSKGNEGKVIIIDLVFDERHDENEMLEGKLLLNIFFTAKHNSKLRSEQEWKQLSLKAGFKGFKMFPMFGLRSLIMLHP
ncbi:hypothetical protein QN277_018992 [Acacia crassicarpa]|uniref:isoflavone 7-O-methyltransferase n=1 Tax=Acacia crassicarpa TaxID=499986 RepID=A0AAE1JUR8_9FABA|nr:hypothetical protein QN277_018992 [Acacia crassicarpa]